MEKLVTLKFGDGGLKEGFSVTLQISEAGQQPFVEQIGYLPPAPELEHTYQRWHVAYRHLGSSYRLEARNEGFAKNVSRVEDCAEVALTLQAQFNQWLNSDSFRPLHDKLLEKLAAQDQVRIILQTQQKILQHLPWHSWMICDRNPNAEIAFSAPAYERLDRPVCHRDKVRILAILGYRQGIDIQTDQALLNHLPQAEVHFLVEPNRQQLNDTLWDLQGWDILFFAGHSDSQSQSQSQTTGQLSLNPNDRLTIPELKSSLRKAIERGLKIAIFNSCNGLGLAQNLGDLQIPQVLVMREPIPDPVAHEFLKSFLAAFSRGESFYLAVREAREKLQGLEDRYPCATWLPIIYQNPAEQPPKWASLSNSTSQADTFTTLSNVEKNSRQQTAQSSSLQPLLKLGWLPIVIASLLSTVATLGVRQMGVLQSWELRGFDTLMKLRSYELPDPRILVITITEADIQAQNDEPRQGSLSDGALSKLLEKLAPMQPRVIGLDIYRDFAVSDQHPQLVQQLQSTPNFIATCQSSNQLHDNPGILPPPEVPAHQVSFSDVPQDPDAIPRRQLLSLTPEPASPCQAEYSFNALIAMNYLDAEDIEITVNPDDGLLQIGAVTFDPLDSEAGGYQNIDASGYQILLNYRHLASPDQIADQVSLSDFLAGRVDEKAIRDRIVLIGTTARSFGDYWQTPYSHGRGEALETAGVFLQAQMISQLLSAVLDGRPLIQTWPDWAEMLWIVTWASVGGILFYGVQEWSGAQFHRIRFVLAGMAAELSLFGFCWLSLSQTSFWLPWASPAVAIVITIVIIETYTQSQQTNLLSHNVK